MTSVLATSPGTSSRTLAAVLAERAAATRAGQLAVVPLDRELVASLVADIAALRREATVSWEHPAVGEAHFALGEATRLRGPRGARLADARAAVLPLFAGLAEADRQLVRAFAAFEFDPCNVLRHPAWEGFGGWQVVVPRVLLSRSGSEWQGIAFAVGGEDDILPSLDTPARPAPTTRSAAGHGLDDAAWQSAVWCAVERIRGGTFEKTVLARQITLPVRRSIEQVLGELAERYPNCFTFRFATAGGDWIGASPERLVALEGGAVRAASLAATRRRGSTEEEDRRLGEELLADPKERAEHAVVVEAVRAALEPVCESVVAPCEPRLMRLPNLQHLYTPVTGRVREGVTVLDLVERMHPTPAVGGWPREQGVAAIRALEAMDRGWYAAPVGWFDAAGNGEFAVALRAARVTGDCATLFAGAGIVAASQPERELAETNLKLRPLAEALGAPQWT
ncbi:MAG: isochorismate synthase [Dehalococcoidia bacterium]|nr:isochorismate synthase [Dehalococcoidia bacterium]